MTIKNLPEFLRERSIPKLGRDGKNDTSPPFYLNQLKGVRVAIETAGMIYKQNYAAVNSVVERHSYVYVDGVGWSSPSIDEVHTMFKVFFRNTVKNLLATGIRPVFVLEGRSPQLKKNTAKKRADQRATNESKLDAEQKNLNLDAFKSRLRNSYPPNHVQVNISIEVLTELNVPTIRAKHEAEGVCAFLVNTPDDHPLHCHCALSDDYDIFMYGCKAVIRGLHKADPKVGGFEVTGIAYVDILLGLGLLVPASDVHTDEEFTAAHEKFRLFCILCGTDYSDNVYGFGPAKVLKLITEKNLDTYEKVCAFDERFKAIPYEAILKTMEENLEYGIVHIPPTP